MQASSLLVVVMLCLGVCTAKVEEYGIEAYPQTTACPATPPQATVTFNITCSVVDVRKASCWSPHAPTLSDVVVFPPDTNAQVEFANAYYPLRAKTIVVAKGATILMRGGAFEASACIYVQGTLNMVPLVVDKGSAPQDGAFLGDSTMPFGQDCKLINQGFTPRICGPGDLIVTDQVTVNGLYASLFIRTFVQSTGTLTAVGDAFLWGNTTNHGVINAPQQIYFHGALYNYNVATFSKIRFDKWIPWYGDTGMKADMVVYNEGNLTFIGGSAGQSMFDIVSTDEASWNENYYYSTYSYTVKLVNKKQLTFEEHVVNGPMVLGGIRFDIFNLPNAHVLWNYSHGASFTGTGTFVNMGTYTAASSDWYNDGYTTVYLSDYLSVGGKLVTKNGGAFVMGNGAGIDKKTTAVCKKKGGAAAAAARAKKEKAMQLPVATTTVVALNQTCKPGGYGGCPTGYCCGKDGKCEPTNCHNYGGSNFWCCPDNGFCGGSSHGPYCGSGAFLWQIDAECVEEQKFVDRYEFEFVKRAFKSVQLPVFGRSRYSFRGHSTISGPGSLIFTEPIELVSGSTLSIEKGAAVRAVIEESEPFRGSGGTVSVGDGGRLVFGGKPHFTNDRQQHTVKVGRGAQFHVPRHTTAYFKTSSNIHFAEGSRIRVDGQVIVMADETGVQPRAALFCDVEGDGAVVSDETDRRC